MNNSLAATGTDDLVYEDATYDDEFEFEVITRSVAVAPVVYEAICRVCTDDIVGF